MRLSGKELPPFILGRSVSLYFSKFAHKSTIFSRIFTNNVGFALVESGSAFYFKANPDTGFRNRIQALPGHSFSNLYLFGGKREDKFNLSRYCYVPVTRRF
jgi:hypothetical protein